MKPPEPTRKPFYWSEWLLYGALVLWVLTLVPGVIWGWPVVWAFMGSSATAAWVQTAGSLVGLGIAVWVPWRMRENELQDARRAALSIAVYMVAIMRIARKRRAGMSVEASETVLMHLGVATRLWAQVRLEMMPRGNIPAFVALVSLADEATGWAGRRESDPILMARLAAVWDDMSARTEALVASIHPTWRPRANLDDGTYVRESPTDDLRSL